MVGMEVDQLFIPHLEEERSGLNTTEFEKEIIGTHTVGITGGIPFGRDLKAACHVTVDGDMAQKLVDAIHGIAVFEMQQTGERFSVRSLR